MSVWEEIKDRLSVEEVLGQYIQLLPAGSNYRALCPFHKEKTPSLMVNPQKGIWHCFGCGEGGDIFSFVARYENITKQESLFKLASQAHVSIQRKPLNQDDNLPYQGDGEHQNSQEIRKEVERKLRGLEILDWVGDLYHKLLLKILLNREHVVTQYCLERNLDQTIIEKFKIGYAPGGNFLLKLANKHNINLDELVMTGVIKRDDQNTSDVFKDRLIIPIPNHDNQICGFTGRKLPNDQQDRPKYLNSPQTQWFNKSKIWFGWYEAKKEIIKQQCAIVVEGNMDVITLHSNGIANTIASQGTSFTLDQLSQLKKITKKVVIAFDNDEAGKVASRKLYLQSIEKGFEVYQVLLPSEFKDIDEYISQFKKQGIQPPVSRMPDEIVGLKIKDYLDNYMLSRQGDLRDERSDIQRKAIIDVMEIISPTDDLRREQATQVVSKLTGISTSVLNGIHEKKPKSSQNQELEYTPQQNSLDPLRVLRILWQNAVGDALKKKALDDIKELFDIVRFLLADFEEYTDFNDYLEKNKLELDAIGDEINLSAKDQMKVLMLHLDSISNRFIHKENLAKLYVKQRAKGKNKIDS